MKEGQSRVCLSLKAYWIDEGSHDEILSLFRNLSLTLAWNLPTCKWQARASGTIKLSNTAANGKIRQLDTQIQTINMIQTT